MADPKNDRELMEMAVREIEREWDANRIINPKSKIDSAESIVARQ